jgi:hypothetical protein
MLAIRKLRNTSHITSMAQYIVLATEKTKNITLSIIKNNGDRGINVGNTNHKSKSVIVKVFLPVLPVRLAELTEIL